MLNRFTVIPLFVLISVHATLFGNTLAYDTTRIKLEAVNLSEDMSTMSSRNDEIVVLVYDYTDTSKLAKPLAAESFVFDSSHRKKEFRVPGASQKKRLLFFLVEQDTQKPVLQVEAAFRKHFKEIITLVEQRDRVALEKLTGTDDLLGYKIIEGFNTGPDKTPFAFIGRFKLDKFHYKILIDK